MKKTRTLSLYRFLLLPAMILLLLINSCKRDIVQPKSAPLGHALSLSEAKKYFETNVNKPGGVNKDLTKGKSTSSQVTIQDILYNKQPVWDQAYQKLLSTGLAVKIPLDFGNVRKVVDEQTKAFVPYSTLNYLLMYKDSLQRIHTEWVTLNPTLRWLNGQRDRYEGVIVIRDWNGKVLKSYSYGSSGSSSSKKPGTGNSVMGGGNYLPLADGCLIWPVKDKCTCYWAWSSNTKGVGTWNPDVCDHCAGCIDYFCMPEPECETCPPPPDWGGGTGGTGGNTGGGSNPPGSGGQGGGGTGPNDYTPPNCNPDPNYVDPHIVYPDGSMSVPACSDIPVPQYPPVNQGIVAVQRLIGGLGITGDLVRGGFLNNNQPTAITLFSYLNTNGWTADNMEFAYWVISYLNENPQEDLNFLLTNKSSVYYSNAEMETMINSMADPLGGGGIELYLVVKHQGSKLFELSRYSVAGNSVQAGAYSLTPHYSKNGTLLFYAAFRNAQNGIEYIVRANQLSSFTSRVGYFTAAADLVYMNGMPSSGMIQAMSGDRISGLLDMWADALKTPQYWVYLAHILTTFPSNSTIPPKVITELSKPHTPNIIPSGFGSTGRTVANNLTEQLAMKEIMSNPHVGQVIIPSINDIRWMGWSKMSNTNAHGVEIHYVAKFQNGVITAVDDFKFKL